MQQNSKTPKSNRYKAQSGLGLDPLPPMAVTGKDGKQTYITADEYRSQFLNPWLTQLNAKNFYAYDSTQLDHVKYAKNVGYITPQEYQSITSKYIGLGKQLRNTPLLKNNQPIYVTDRDGKQRPASAADLTYRNQPGQSTFVKFAGLPSNDQELMALGRFNQDVITKRNKQISDAGKPINLATETAKALGRDVTAPFLGAGKATIEMFPRAINAIDRELGLPTDPAYDAPEELGDSYGDQIKAWQEGIQGGLGLAAATPVNIAERGLDPLRKKLYGSPEWQNAVNASSAGNFMSDVANRYPDSKEYGLGLITGEAAASLPFAAATGIAGMNIAGSIGGRLLSYAGKEAVGRGIGIGMHVAAPMLAQIAQQKIAPNETGITDAVAWLTNPAEQAKHATVPRTVTDRFAEADPTGEFAGAVHLLGNMALFGGGTVGHLNDVKSIASNGMQAYNRLSKIKGAVPAAAGALKLTGRNMLARQVGTEAAFGLSSPLQTLGQQIVSDMSGNKDMAPTPTNWATSIASGLFGTRPSANVGAALHSSPLHKMDVASMAYSRAHNIVHAKMDRPASILNAYIASEKQFKPNLSDVKKAVQIIERVNDGLLTDIRSTTGDPTALPPAFKDSVTLTKAVIKAHKTGDWTGLESFEPVFKDAFNNIRSSRFTFKSAGPNPLDDESLTGRYTENKAELHSNVKKLAAELHPIFERLLSGKQGEVLPELNEGKSYYGLHIDSDRYYVFTKDFKNAELIKATEKDFDPNGKHKDIQVINPHEGVFKTAPDEHALKFNELFTKHVNGLRTLLGRTFERDGEFYSFRGITPDGKALLSREGEDGAKMLHVSLRDLEQSSTDKLTKEESSALSELASLETDTPHDGVYNSAFIDAADIADNKWPTKLPLNGRTMFKGRLIGRNNDLGAFQLPNGVILLHPGVTESTPIETPLGTSQIDKNGLKHDRNFKDQITDHDADTPGLFTLPLTDAVGNERQTVIRLSGDHVNALKELFKDWTGSDEQQQALDAIIDSVFAESGQWSTKREPYKPEIGDTVKLKDDESQEFVIVTHPTDTTVVTKPISDIEAPPYVFNVNDVWVVPRRRLSASERMHNERTNIIGLDPDAARPASGFASNSAFFRALQATAYRGGTVVVDKDIAEATGEELSTAITNFVHKEHVDVAVAQSLLESLRRWMQSNPDQAHVASMALDTAVGNAVLSRDINGFMPLHFLLSSLIDSRFQEDLTYLSNQSVLAAGMADDVMNVENIYPMSATPLRDKRALLFAHARQINNVLYSFDRINNKIIDRAILKLAKKLGVEEGEELTKFASDVKRVAGILRSVHPVLHELLIDGAIPTWFVDTVSGLPADMQIHALRLPRDSSGKLAAGNTGNDLIDAYNTEDGFAKAVRHIRDLIAGGVDVTQMLHDSGLDFLREYATRPNDVDAQSALRAKLRSHDGIREAKQFHKSAIDSVVQLYTERAGTTFTTHVINAANGQSVPVRDLAVAAYSADSGHVESLLPDAEEKALAKQVQQEIQSVIGKSDINDLTTSIKNLTDTESLMGGIQVAEFDNLPGVLNVAKPLSRTDSEAAGILATWQQVDPSVQRQLLSWHGAVYNILHAINVIRGVGDEKAFDSLILALYQGNNTAESLRYLFKDEDNYQKFLDAASEIDRKVRAGYAEDADVASAAEHGASGFIGGYDSARRSALEALHMTIQDITDELVDRIKQNNPDLDPLDIQQDLWVWASLSQQTLFKAMAQNLGRIIKDGTELTQLLNSANNEIARFKDNQRLHATATDYGKSLQEFKDALTASSTAGSKWLGGTFDSENLGNTITDAMQVTPVEAGTTLEQWDAIKRQAAEVATVLHTIGRVGLEYDPNDLVSLQAMLVDVDAETLGYENANGRTLPTVAILGRGGLERALELHLLATARMDHGELAESVQHTLPNEAGTNLYNRNVAAWGYRNALQARLVNSRLTDLLHVEYNPGGNPYTRTKNAWSEKLDVPSKRKIDINQRFADDLIEEMKTLLQSVSRSAATSFVGDIEKLFELKKDADGGYKVKFSELLDVFVKHGGDLDALNKPNKYGTGVLLGQGKLGRIAISPMSITNTLRGLIKHGLINLREGGVPLPADHPALTVFSLSPSVIRDASFRNNVTSDIIKELGLLYKNLLLSDREKSDYDFKYNEIQKAQLTEISRALEEILEDRPTEEQSAVSFKRIEADKANASRVAKAISTIYDRFVYGGALRQLDYDMATNSRRNEYFTLAVAAGIDSAKLERMYNLNISVAQLLSHQLKEGSSYTGELLTSREAAELQALRIAQLHQDGYQKNMLFLASDILAGNMRFGRDYLGYQQQHFDAQRNPASQVVWLRRLGFDQTKHVTQHEVGHAIFNSLPHYLQVEWMMAIRPEKGVKEGKNEQIQKEWAEMWDQIDHANKLLENWKIANPNKHLMEFELPGGRSFWNSVNQEASTTALQSFIMKGELIQSRTRGTIDASAMGFMHSLSTNLREAWTNTFNRNRTLDAAVVLDENNNPYEGFWYKLFPTRINSPIGTNKGNSFLFYPTQHNSFLQFITPTQAGSKGFLGAVTNAWNAAKGFKEQSPTGEIHGNLKNVLFPDALVQAEMENVLNDEGYKKGTTVVHFKPGPYKQQDDESYNPLTKGFTTTGRVIGIAFASKFNSESEVPSQFKILGWNVDGNGDRRLWVMHSRQDDNGWYQSVMPYMHNGVSHSQTLYTADYSYVVESYGSLRVYNAEGIGRFGRPKWKLAENKVDPNDTSKRTPSVYTNVRLRTLVPHTAIEDGHVFAVGSGKFANKQFGEVLYSAISRVSQSIVNANRQIDFDHQQAFEEALAAKYGGDPNAIEDYWQALSDLMDSRAGNVKDRITKANAAEAAVISGARVDGWQRTFATSRDLPRVINELYTDETQRAIVQEALDEFLIGSRSGMTNENGQMAVPFIGIPHKIIFGSDFDNSKSKAEFQGALLTHWLKSMTDEELGVVFGQKIMPAFAEARKTRTAMDWDALGLNTVVTASGKQINIRSLLETLFDPEMDADHFNNLLQTLNSARSGQKTEFTQKTTLDHVNRSALYHTLTKVFDNAYARKEFLESLLNIGGTPSTPPAIANHLNAKTQFNAIRHVMAVDSHMRRTALRNWRKWSIHDIDGESVILNTPGRDIGARANTNQTNMLTRVNLATGAIDFVQKQRKFNINGISESYVSVMPASRAFAALSTELKSKAQMFGVRRAAKSRDFSLNDIFGDDNPETVFRNLIGGEEYNNLMSTPKSSVVFFTPGGTGDVNHGTNGGLFGWKVTNVAKKGEQAILKITPTDQWWKNNDNLDMHDVQQILGVAFQRQSDVVRSNVSGRQLYGEAYHIARMLVLQDRLSGDSKFKLPIRINDKPLFNTDELTDPNATNPRIVMNDVANLGRGNTWYSMSHPHEREYSEHFKPDGQIEIPPAKNIQNDPEAYANWAAAAAIDRGEKYAASRVQDFTFVPDPSLEDTIGLGRDGHTEIIYVPEKIYDRETGLPKNDVVLYSLASGGSPPAASATPAGTVTHTPAKTAPAPPPSAPHTPTQYSGNGLVRFAKQVLGAIKSDAQFILGCDLSTFGIQMVNRGINDPVGFVTSAVGLAGMIMPNREDLPFFLGVAIDRAARLGGNTWGNLGDWHYDWTMNQYLKKYNQWYGTSYDFDDLEKYGWNSTYSSWRRMHKINQSKNYAKYTKITDTPFEPVDETVSRGILRETNLYAKRWDQTRLLCRDIFALKVGLDVLRNADNQVTKKPYDVASDKHSEMRNANLDFGLQNFGDLPGQAPLFQFINGLSNATQNAPSYHRNYINSNPILRAISLYLRDNMANGLWRKMTGKLNGGLLAGDIFDVSWERKYEEYQTSYARRKQWGRTIARIGIGMGILGVMTAIQYLIQKSDPNTKDLAFMDNDYLDITKKQIGYQKLGRNTVFEISPVSKLMRYGRPFVAAMSPSEDTVKARINAFARSWSKTYVESRWGNLMSIASSAFRGNEFGGEPSFDTNPGAAVLQATDSPYDVHRYDFSRMLLPLQSNFVSNHFNLVSAAAYNKDAAHLAALGHHHRRNIELNALTGKIHVDDMPVLSTQDLMTLNFLEAYRKFGGTAFVEEPDVKKVNDSVQVDGKGNDALRATLKRWSYLFRNEFFDWASLSETQRKHGWGPIFNGYGVKEIGNHIWGFPSSDSIKLAQPIEDPVLPIGKDKAAAYGNYKSSKPDTTAQKLWDDIRVQMGLMTREGISNERK